MKIKIPVVFILIMLNVNNNLNAQSAPESGSAMASSRDATTPINNFTGIPSISFPLYNYSHPSGIGVSLSLDYFGGGIKLHEAPSPAGLGWNLAAGGAIIRTPRGIPDDCPYHGYLYNPVIKVDPRSDIWTYYDDCVDGEQDIFQFNFGGRSGSFYIGKDSQFVISPLSKIRIKMIKDYYDPEGTLLDTLIGTIKQFVITTEEGVKYIFAETEMQDNYVNVCGPFTVSSSQPIKYASVWYLSKIISYSGRDSISFKYQSLLQQIYFQGYDQKVTINGATITHSDTTKFYGGVYNQKAIASKVISEIDLPSNKKISMYYSQRGQFRGNELPLLRNVKIMDSVLRFGYLLNWDTTTLGSYSKDFLMGFNYYTNNHVKPGYIFRYSTPYFTIDHADTTTYLYNRKDHWGFYNGTNNRREKIPTVSGAYTSTLNREASSAATASSLSSITDPSGGVTYYQFENNDTYPYDPDKQSTGSINVNTSTSTSISISRVLGTKSYFRIFLDGSVTRTGSSPISGPGDLIIKLTDGSGTPVSVSDTINFNQFLYNGFAEFSFTIPNGSYLLKTNLGSGTTSGVTLPATITWYNQTGVSGTGKLIGGIRIKQISHYDPFTAKTDTLVTYKYLTESGKSSGFLGTKPVYDYYYSNGVRIIVSDPRPDINYSDGIALGYSRVEVIKGSIARNLGKQVYYYTNIEDQDFDISPPEFPYFTKQQRDWAWGAPKKILVFNNNGQLIHKTVNSYNYLIQDHSPDTLNLSIRTTTNSQSPTYTVTSYLAEKYYPECGLPQLVSSVDTFYHSDASVTTNSKSIYYDSCYNVKKIFAPYDLNRGLNLEERIYYPYNYTVTGIIGNMRDSGLYIPVSKESWIIGDANPRLLSATITQFQKPLSGIIRPAATYALQSNAPVSLATIGAFDSSVLIRNTTYFVKQEEYTTSRPGLPLQTKKSLSGVTNSIIYGYDGQTPIAKVSNATYTDVAYTGFEANSDGTFIISSAARDTSAITGTQSFNLSSQTIQKTALNSAITYIITYWTKGYVSISGASSAILTDARGSWNFYTQKISGVTSVTITGGGLIDELRLYPQDANMVTTSYDATGLVITACDANNNIVYNEYDSVNRLKVVRDKDKNVIKKYDYSDTIRVVDFTPHWIADTDTFHWSCELDTSGHYTGRVMHSETDSNYNSETYLSYREVYDHIDSTRCPPPIPDCGSDPAVKWVFGTCETGCRDNISTVRKKVLVGGSMVFRWVCTWHYIWTDYSTSDDYEEYNLEPCDLGGCPEDE